MGVLDEDSGVYKVRLENEERHATVLHSSNLRSWNPPEGAGTRVKKEEVEMPDRTEVLKRFGFHDDVPSTEDEAVESDGARMPEEDETVENLKTMKTMKRRCLEKRGQQKMMKQKCLRERAPQEMK